MNVSCIQMNMTFAAPEENYARAEELIAKAMQEQPDVIVLPETWTTGFFPREDLAGLSDHDGAVVKARMGALAKRFGVNLVAGSVCNQAGGRLYNSAFVFSRQGDCIAQYDKTHLFSPMGEERYFTPGDHRCTFLLDGQQCGLIICYDIRFPELIRSMSVKGLDFLFVVSQWPSVRIPHLLTLARARAIENQMFVVCCNSCGSAGKTVYGGNSTIHDPWGECLAQAGGEETILTARCDPALLEGIRSSINVFSDRRVELYDCN